MSFGNRMRATRSTGLTTLLALAATAGMGATVAPPPITANAATQAAQAPHEFVDEKTRKRRAVPTVTNRVKPGSQRNPDSRKARRRLLMALLGLPNSGRQWVRARKTLRRGPYAYLLNTETADLAKMLAAR